LFLVHILPIRRNHPNGSVHEWLDADGWVASVSRIEPPDRRFGGTTDPALGIQAQDPIHWASWRVRVRRRGLREEDGMKRHRLNLIIALAAIAIAASACGKSTGFSLSGGDASLRQTGSWDWLDQRHHP
jgi:hypothetical protein